MSGDRQSKRLGTGKTLGPVRQSTAWATVVLGSLAFSSAAFGQADQLALSENTAVDEDAGIRVPEGFDATVFAERVGRARQRRRLRRSA
jgi:hypothetical protein